jgi:hypothetical protein
VVDGTPEVADATGTDAAAAAADAVVLAATATCAPLAELDVPVEHAASAPSATADKPITIFFPCKADPLAENTRAQATSDSVSA